MTLSEWMAREGLNLTSCAQRLQMPVTTLHGYLNSRRVPSLAMARRIKTATSGAVTVADLLPEIASEFVEADPAPQAPAPGAPL